MKKKNSFGISIGASSILVIIVILALVCFAGLSLASANADYSLCKKLSDRTQSYYETVSKTYEILAEEYKKEPSVNDRPFTVNSILNENQELQVEAVLSPSANDNLRYSIKKFEIVTVHEEALDNSLSLLIGN